MKKLFIKIAFFIFGATNVFAWTNITQFGIKGSVPKKITTNGDFSADYTFNSTGMELGYIGIFNSGLAIKGDVNLGLGSITGDFSTFSNPDLPPMNFNVAEKLGVGYSFINSDKITLAAFFDFGVSLDYAISMKKFIDKTVTTSLENKAFFLGGDITAIFTPSKIFSLYASVSTNIAFSQLTANTKIENNDDEYLTDYYSEDYFAKPYLMILPSVGLAWKF